MRITYPLTNPCGTGVFDHFLCSIYNGMHNYRLALLVKLTLESHYITYS